MCQPLAPLIFGFDLALLVVCGCVFVRVLLYSFAFFVERPNCDTDSQTTPLILLNY
jgi:hypothetical protein